MTTVTPSDRAGAASAKRSASIPGQRSGQALRLLVLGTGEDAAAFRERAIEAGAELAQRFSVRVTHVVAEDGIGDEDARVVRARTAGVPVLDLSAGDRLLVEAEAAGEAESAEAAEVVVVEVAAVEGGDAGEVGTRDAAEDVAEDQVAVDEESAPWAQVVRPRSEVVPEVVDVTPVEVGPSDVFTGSALEAVLLFPPLSVGDGQEAEKDDASALRVVDGGSAGCGCGEADVDACAGADAADIGADGDVRGDVDEVVAEEVGGWASGVGVGADGPEVADIANIADISDVADASGVASGLDPNSDSADVADPRAAGAAAVSSVAWALVPLVSLGLLTPVSMGYAAYRMRSRALWAATAVYSIAVAVAFTLSAAAPLRTGAHTTVGDLLIGCFAASWLGGTVHGFLVRRRVFS